MLMLQLTGWTMLVDASIVASVPTIVKKEYPTTVSPLMVATLVWATARTRCRHTATGPTRPSPTLLLWWATALTAVAMTSGKLKTPGELSGERKVTSGFSEESDTVGLGLTS